MEAEAASPWAATAAASESGVAPTATSSPDDEPTFMPVGTDGYEIDEKDEEAKDEEKAESDDADEKREDQFYMNLSALDQQSLCRLTLVELHAMKRMGEAEETAALRRMQVAETLRACMVADEDVPAMNIEVKPGEEPPSEPN